MGSDGGHVPVLLAETLEALAVRPGGLFVDGTVGLGGHAAAILGASAPDGRLLGLDRDGETLARAREALAPFGDRVRLEQGDFREIPQRLGSERASGILVDLGISSAQLDDPDRGFSFQADGPLDMRMDRSSGETAADVVNRLPERDLADLIYRFGEERASRRIARAIARAREREYIGTTRELAEIVRRASPRSGRPGLHPATRTFQALRIRVNRELEGLGAALAAAARCLAPAGRLAVIAFHSLEDREAKTTLRALASEGFRLVTKKPVRPGEEEVRRNPRARSARLRVLAREEVEPRRGKWTGPGDRTSSADSGRGPTGSPEAGGHRRLRELPLPLRGEGIGVGGGREVLTAAVAVARPSREGQRRRARKLPLPLRGEGIGVGGR